MNAWRGHGLLAADDVAAALGLPPPTPDQKRVIEAPPLPALVVAGAGSGKTETMASRVVWLVANGHVRPDEVLGLTFTRKAAGELAERIDARLGVLQQFASRGLLDRVPGWRADGILSRMWESVRDATGDPRHALSAHLDGLARERGAEGAVTDDDSRGASAADRLIAGARVSTYNAFADTLVREHGAHIGRDPDELVLSESAAWLLVRRTVLESADERLAVREERFSTIVDAVHRFAGTMLDHRADPAAVARHGAELAAGIQPFVNPELQSPGDIERLHRSASALPVLVDLATAYAQAKRARGVLDFADQVAGALDIVERAPQVARALREQYRVVLLDEYQDTSVLQTRLLADIFRGTAVMAVGDPQQSIYGWRGASADNLAAFSGAFGDGQTATARFSLMTSWRNDVAVLTAANALIAPGRADDDPAAPADPAASADPDEPTELAPRAGAAPGTVDISFCSTIDDEAERVAQWFAARRTAPGDSSGAILFRAKRHMPTFGEALARAGVPHRILGLGGLLQAPEVVDVVSVLRVIDDASAGSALLRVLTGPRFRIGLRDLDVLRQAAGMLAQGLARGVLSATSSGDVDTAALERVRASVGPDESASIVDALDAMTTLSGDHALLRGLSAAGAERLRDAGAMFRRLRALATLPIGDLVRAIEIELRLDIELAANEARGPARIATTQLRAFVDELRGFLATDERGSLRSLLAWLDHAEESDELQPRTEPPEPGVVQLLTIHGAKGLEWDDVAVPRLVADELPQRPRSTLGELGYGELPARFRGDRDAIPAFTWSPPVDLESVTEHDGAERAARRKQAGTELRRAIADYKTATKAHAEQEERRLAYVALTRARHGLLLSGSTWAGQRVARRPSPYLQQVASALGRDEIVAPDDNGNPYLDRQGARVTWPIDPLGARRHVVEDAGALVRRAISAAPAAPDRDLALLLAERAAAAAPVPVEGPDRLAASRFKDYVTGFAAAASRVARPLPERPYRQTRIGTLFHAWVESRAEPGALAPMLGARSSGFLDESAWEIDDDVADEPDAAIVAADQAELERLQDVFERSEWASLAPLAVELEIDCTLVGARGLGRVVCKLDAVYRRADRGDRIEIVDWKTGAAPTGRAERAERMLQLALYRVAYHKATGVPLDAIDVALFYVSEDRVIRGEDVPSESELAQRWNAAREARSASRSSSSASSSSDSHSALG